MVLHTTFAGLNLGTTGGTTYDSVGSVNFFPSGDSEVQVRGGQLPRLIGWDNLSGDIVQIGAGSADYDFFRFGLNTWAAADYYQAHVMKTTNGAAAKFGNFVGDGQPIWNLPGAQLDQDADWDVRVNTTTASMTNMCALYLSYGPNVYPYKGGQIISRQVDFSGGADGAYPAYGTMDTITDLDPRIVYRLAGMQLGNVEDKEHIGMFVQSASNNTTVGALMGSWKATTYHPNSIPIWFPHDSIIFSGVETVSVGSFSEVAQNPTGYIFFEKYGTTGAAGTVGTLAGTNNRIGTGVAGITGIGGTGSIGGGSMTGFGKLFGGMGF